MAVNMSTFWSDLGVVGGNTLATNQYDLFNGLTFNDGFVCGNQYDFFTHLGTNRYEFFKSYNSVDSNIVDEYTFYQNTNDPNIFDKTTFYQLSAGFINGSTTTTTTQAPVTSVGLLGAWDGFSEEIPMSSEDDVNWELLSYQMPEGSGSYACYFRVNNSVDWGGPDFPIGVAIPNASTIPAVFGEWDIFFNSTTGDYEFDSLAPALPYLFSVGDETRNCDTVSAQTLYTQSTYIYDGLVLYSDSGRTEVFSGGGLYYTEINVNGWNFQTMTISNEGVVGNMSLCSFPYLFSNGSEEADCNAVSAQTLYTAYTPPEDNRAMYTDAELTTQFDGGNLYYTYLDDNGVPIATMIITETGTITTYTVCVTPTPTPTNTQTPTPTPTNTQTPTPTPSSTPTPTPTLTPTPSGVLPTVTYVTNRTNTANSNSYTFNSTDIGGSGLIIIGCSYSSSNSNTSVSTLRVNGTSATKIVEAVGSSSTTPSTALFVFRVTAGTTADISLTLSGGNNARCMGISIWRVQNNNSDTITVSNAAIQSYGTSVSTTLTSILSNSVIIAVNSTYDQLGSPSPVTWTNVTERFDVNTEGNDYMSGGDSTSSGGGSLTITSTTASGEQSIALCAIAIR